MRRTMTGVNGFRTTTNQGSIAPVFQFAMDRSTPGIRLSFVNGMELAPFDPQARKARASPEWQHSLQDTIAVHKKMLDCGAGVYCDEHRKTIRAVVVDVDKGGVDELVVWPPGR